MSESKGGPRLLIRRGLLTAGLLAGAWPALSAAAQLASLADDRIPFGLQFFSVNDVARTDLAGTLREVRAIGYDHVELVGYYGQEVAALSKLLRGAGLVCDSIHLRPLEPQNGGPSLAQAPDLHIARCRDLGVKFLVVPGPWFPERLARELPRTGLTLPDVVRTAQLMKAADWDESADLVSTCAQRAKLAGLQVLYHNGNMEFADAGGEPAFDRLLRAFDRESVQFELDCGWIQVAGHDPLPYLEALGGRARLMHIKDFLATPPNTEMHMNSTQMGGGVVDLRTLLRAARAARVERVYVEQEAPHTIPSLESARRNYEYMHALEY